MPVPRYLIEKKAKEFDEDLERAHAHHPHEGYGNDAYDLPGLGKYRSVVRDLRQGNRRKKST